MELDALLAEALATGDDSELRATLNLGLVPRFAQAVGAMVTRPDAPVAALESLLDGWAALPVPGDVPEAVLAGAAYAAYGEVGAVRPDWWDDEIAKLRRGATDDRRPVRETVPQALRRLLEADWPRTVEALRSWAADPAPLVVLAAAAAVAEPRLVRSEPAARDAVEVQRRAVAAYRSLPPERRRRDDAMALRQALGSTLAVTGDLTLLEELASSDDPALRWIARQNLG